MLFFMLLDYFLTLLSFHPRLAFFLYKKKLFQAHFWCKTPFPLRTLFKLVLLFICICSGSSTIWTVSETVHNPAACKIHDVYSAYVKVYKWSKLFQPWFILSKKESGFFARANGLPLQFYLSLLLLRICQELLTVAGPALKEERLTAKRGLAASRDPGDGPILRVLK